MCLHSPMLNEITSLFMFFARVKAVGTASIPGLSAGPVESGSDLFSQHI